MATPQIRLLMRDYDYLTPFFRGEVTAEGIDLTIDRKTPMTEVTANPAIVAGELSFSRYLIGIAAGNRDFVGIPFFPIRAFQHRCFYVRRGSGLRSFGQLEGKRIGTNDWPATGNTWSRAAMREQGVRIDGIRWIVGPIDDRYPRRPQVGLPQFAEAAPGDHTLRDMVIAGELDALMCPVPPKGFYAPASKIVRLFRNYKREERGYYARTGIYPTAHIVGIRREVFERDPSVAVSLYRALDQARLQWQQHKWDNPEFTPWELAAIEEAGKLMGSDWQPNGVAANRKPIQALCEEEYAQGLVSRPISPDEVFADFDAALKT
jgi:4,5-dihydroxyphthalate decarboxylase